MIPSREELRFRLVELLGGGLLAGLFATWRYQRRGADHYLRFRNRNRPVIFVFWHGQLLPLIHPHRDEGIVALVSEHRDGEYIARLMERYGFATARGSSTRGGVKGIKGLIRAAREGRDLALTPDGPQGPPHRFKAGALAVARATGLPLIPVAAGASSAWRLGSWDGFLVPRPCSTIRILYGEPVRISRDAGRRELNLHASRLEETLTRMTRSTGLDDSSPSGEFGPPSSGSRPTEVG